MFQQFFRFGDFETMADIVEGDGGKPLPVRSVVLNYRGAEVYVNVPHIKFIAPAATNLFT